MIGDTSERVDIDIARDRWVRRNDRVDCKGDYCLFWRLEWVRAYQRVHGIARVCELSYRTHTRQTCDLKPAGFPVPMTNPTDRQGTRTVNIRGQGI
jgi:hypothetical protein